MRTNFLGETIIRAQDMLAGSEREFICESEGFTAAVAYSFAVPVVVLDTVLEVLKRPLAAIEALALAVINCLGALFVKECSTKDALRLIENALSSVVCIPVQLFMAIPKTAYQLWSLLSSPGSFESVAHFHYRYYVGHSTRL